jgi:hypothetical protein
LLAILKSQQSWVDVSDPLVEITYMDQEEDWIVFKSQEEWNICLETAIQLQMVVRINVAMKSTPTTEKVISFVKGIDFKGLWGSVLQNVTNIQPIMATLRNGLCHPQIYDNEEVPKPRPATIVDKVDVEQMDLTFVDDAFHEEFESADFNNVTDSFYSEMSVYIPEIVEEIEMPKEEIEEESCDESSFDDISSGDESDEEEQEDKSSDSDSDEDKSSDSSDDEDEEQEVKQVECPPQYVLGLQQLLDMGFAPSEREKLINYLIDFDGDVVRVVQHLLEE